MKRATLFAAIVVLGGCRFAVDGLQTSEPLTDGAIVSAETAPLPDTSAGDGSSDEGVDATTDSGPSSCTDGVRNGDETDVDCGGPKCTRCKVGASCGSGTDCDSKVCTGGSCAAPTCFDGVVNGEETDVDCGGPKCLPCKNGGACARGADCESSLCDAKVCRYAKSCKELHSLATTLPSAQYTLDPDQMGPRAPIKTYCDMETDGGGWTFFAHVDGTYTGGAFFETDFGGFRADRVDDGKTWSVGASVLPYVGHTNMMVTLDTPEPTVAAPANKLVVFAYGAGASAFSSGPLPCTGLDAGFTFRTTLTGAFSGTGGTNACDASRWYASSPAGSANFLIAFHDGVAGVFWGGVMKGDFVFGHDAHLYVR